MSIWHLLLYQPLVNGLIFFYQLLGQNLGLAIIVLTLAIRTALYPLTKPSLEAAKKMRAIAPQLEKLKKKHKNDKQALAQAQLKLYQKNGIKPGAGCLPQIVQILILIALFQAFRQVLTDNGQVIEKLNSVLYPVLQLPKETVINTKFAYLNLTQPDLINLPFKIKILNFVIDKIPGLFLLAAAAVQFLTSRLMIGQTLVVQQKAKETPQQEDDMAAMMQKQMLYMMPLMTLLVGFQFASGLVLYWITFSLFMFFQQLVMQK